MESEGGVNIATHNHNPRGSNDVFICFSSGRRYAVIKKIKPFIDNLNKALREKKLNTFLGNKRSGGGHVSSSIIFKALEESRVSIVVFSKTFASSLHCLDQIVKIVECQEKHNQQVLPIFYDVDPSDVRCESAGSSFQTALAKLQQKSFPQNLEVIQKWIIYLSRLAPAAASYQEWQLNKRDKYKHDNERIDKIVESVVTSTLGSSDIFLSFPRRLSFDGVIHSTLEYFSPVFRTVANLGVQVIKFSHEQEQYLQSIIGSIKNRVSDVSLIEEGERSFTEEHQQKQWRYDVFLSFERSDTDSRNHFTGYLYHALHREDFRPFADQELLEKGDQVMVETTLCKAIEDSRILVVVISKSYVLSLECLKELTMILDSKKKNNQLVIPIFYGVNPSGAMTALEQKHRKGDVEKWRSTLREISKMDPFQIGNDQRHSDIEKIVKRVSDDLPCYDIFLSFNGKYDNSDFTDFLQTALRKKEFKTFTKDKGSKDGEYDIVTAIKKSRISIIIFSENYACSSSCLDELVTILDCMKTNRQLVWPIFYKVKPSDVRHQTNSFQRAMIKHQSKFGHRHDKVKEWKLAMSKAGNLNGGWHLENGNEYAIIDKIVEKAIEI